jgi:hypothetical protein
VQFGLAAGMMAIEDSGWFFFSKEDPRGQAFASPMPFAGQNTWKKSLPW